MDKERYRNQLLELERVNDVEEEGQTDMMGPNAALFKPVSAVSADCGVLAVGRIPW